MIHFTGVIALIILITALIWFVVGWWVSSIERAKQQRNRETEWNHQLNTLRRDRDSFRDEVEIAHGKIRVLENRRADGNSPPRTPEQEAATLELTARLENSLKQARQQISNFAQKVDALREQSIEREDVLDQLKKKLTDTARSLHEREQKLAELGNKGVDNAATSLSLAATPAANEHEDSHENTIQKLRIELQSQADTAEQDRQRLDHTISEHMQTIGALRKELAQRDAQTTERGEQSNELHSIQKELVELKRENRQHIEKIEQLSQGSKVVEHQRSRLKALQADYDEQQAVLRELARSVDSVELQRTENDELRAKNRTLQSTIEQLNQTSARLAEERNHAAQQLKSQQEQRLREDEALAVRQHGDLKDTIEQQELTISRLQQQLVTREQQYDRELLGMRETMDTQERIVSQLRDVLAKPTSVANPVARPSSVATSPPSPAPQSGDLFAQDEGVIHIPAAPSVKLYTDAPAARDDLKKINGIGPAFERALNDLGLFEFEQIAALTDNDVAWIADSLKSFPDRIVKGRWVEQARRLIAQRSH